jgi:hypothetical protein
LQQVQQTRLLAEFGSNENSFIAMRVLAPSVSAVPSIIMMTTDAPAPVWITSLFRIASPAFSVTLAPLRITVTLPLTLSTAPICGCPPPAAGAPACAY